MAIACGPTAGDVAANVAALGWPIDNPDGGPMVDSTGRVDRRSFVNPTDRDVATNVATRFVVSIEQRDGLRRTTAVLADRTDG